MITQSQIKNELDYDPLTGVFCRRNGHRCGQVAGCLNKRTGYVVISINDKLHYAHRLAWVWMNGDDPIDQIDHINRDRGDNRIANLRSATRQQNQANRCVRIDSGSQLKGVRFHKVSGLWFSSIVVNRKVISLGYYAQPEAAHDAYFDAAKKYFGEFARAA